VSRHCIVVWPAHLASQLIRAQQSKRPKRLMAVSSFAHRGTALLLQAAYSDYQIGAFENFHQLVENTLVVLRPRPKVFFQYELRFANRLESQLLISHLFLLIKQMPPEAKEREIEPLLGNIPRFFKYLINFYFNVEASAHGIGGCLVQHRFTGVLLRKAMGTAGFRRRECR
jgi:hypothetical protein